jgi:tetratricopeptide (TPR) repeat protein
MASTSSADRHRYLIEKYSIPSMGSNSIEGSALSQILERLDNDGCLSLDDQQFLKDKGLFDQYKFVQHLDQTGRADFEILQAPIRRRQNIDRRRMLWEKYDIDYVESPDMRRMMLVLDRLENGAGLAEDDVVWLKTRDHFSSEIRRVFHKNEAELCRREFEKTGDIWQAINANSHFRKANQSEKGLALVGSINVDSLQDKHQHSALLTTKGGSYRDLGRLPEALSVAEKAHALNPKSYHPCTLLGSIYYERREFGLGDAWFAKAVERGAKQDVVDSELRSLLRRVGAEKQREIADHLLRSDPQRYAWVKSIFRKADKAAKPKEAGRGTLK